MTRGPITPELLLRLEFKAYELRRKLIKLTGKVGGAHIGGSFSMMDMMVALHHHFLDIDANEPDKPDRDIFILSKGHAGVGYCTVLGDMGFFPEEELDLFNQTGSVFGVHPDRKGIPGVEASTGSLGHGLGLAVGWALAKKMDQKTHPADPVANARVVAMVGDGEFCEGSIYEAMLAAVQHNVGNLTCILDHNKVSQDGPITETCDVKPVKSKFDAFRWNAVEIDGHDMKQIVETLHALPPTTATKPTAIVMHTVKGKGVPWMENTATWHYGGLDTETERKALNDLERSYESLIAAANEAGFAMLEE